eukprot:GAHX01001623.1.p1 GENE.GAHX01001623.1~~GAHX01001623.1.p1  ORF type:complete len:264 (-),score=44.84 GAHX01001623.1:334-1125(-)
MTIKTQQVLPYLKFYKKIHIELTTEQLTIFQKFLYLYSLRLLTKYQVLDLLEPVLQRSPKVYYYIAKNFFKEVIDAKKWFFYDPYEENHFIRGPLIKNCLQISPSYYVLPSMVRKQSVTQCSGLYRDLFNTQFVSVPFGKEYKTNTGDIPIDEFLDQYTERLCEYDTYLNKFHSVQTQMKGFIEDANNPVEKTDLKLTGILKEVIYLMYKGTCKEVFEYLERPNYEVVNLILERLRYKIEDLQEHRAEFLSKSEKTLQRLDEI